MRGTVGWYGPVMSDLSALAGNRLDDAIRLRRELHAHPELGLDLPRTQERVLDALDGLPLHIRRGTATTSVVGVLDGDRPGPTVLLRADMDALPMPENADVDYASTIDGTMHACGHDLHTAMLVGAAHLLTAQRKQLHGRVLFMFQPGEEGGGGAKVMLDEGLLEGVGDIKAAFAIHVASNVPSGLIAAKGGTQMASADEFSIVIRGRGGHASMPHDALDPIPTACEIVLALQTMITRRVSVFDPAVLTVGNIFSGTTTNVIPETATIRGTMRAVSERTRNLLHGELRRVAEGIASAHSAEVTVTINEGYPVTINNVIEAARALDVARNLVGPKLVYEMPTPVMGAEDFSYVLQRVPGVMVNLGACPPNIAHHEAAPNHSNRALFHEEAMVTGMALHTAMALHHLAPA